MCTDTRIGYRRSTVKPVEGSSTVLIVQSSPKLYLTTAVFAAVTFGSLGPSDAASPGFLDQSLASQLVQSMTQRRILQTDDVADVNCKSRSFEQARVVHQPVIAKHDGYTAKSWQEDWTLNRCGSDVFYRVFYSEIGAGGITLSIAPLDSAGTPVIEPVVASASSAPLLRLTKPLLRGDDVKNRKSDGEGKRSARSVNYSGWRIP